MFRSVDIRVFLSCLNFGPFQFCFRCVFLPNNGAFFVNYLITSALIGTALELCRVPELVSYAGNMACARNDGERRLARKVNVMNH